MENPLRPIEPLDPRSNPSSASTYLPVGVTTAGATMALFGKKFACEGCGMKYATQRELSEHGKMHMASPIASPSRGSSGKFTCGGCGAPFGSEADLKSHAAQMHRM